MTIVVEYFAFCDTPDCPNGTAAGLAVQGADRKRSDLIDDMRADGWRTIKGRHYCGDCVRDRKLLQKGESVER